MKRVVKCDGQILLDEEGRRFAIYDTVVDRFEIVNGNQVWESADELKKDFDEEMLRTHHAGLHPSKDERLALRNRLVFLARGEGY